MDQYPSNPFLEDDTEIEVPQSSPVKVVEADTPRLNERISYEDICKQLIHDGFVLTALELHTELQEIGKPVGFLRDYFSNPGNFERTKAPDLQSTSPPVGLQRSGSIQTFDSLDWSRYSDDGERQAEDRVAGLEFELRKAQDTIKSLRKALTIATEVTVTSEVRNEQPTESKAASDFGAEAIKPHERRAINFLVNEYLLIHDYKLTSVTFAEENENQDFEHWDDVGLNISKPPDLLHLYLDFGKHTVPVTATADAETNDDFYKDKLTDLRGELSDLKSNVDDKKREINSLIMTNESMSTDIEVLTLEINSLKDKLQEQKSSLVFDPYSANTDGKTEYDDEATTDVVDGSSTQKDRRLFTHQPVRPDVPQTFLNHILSMSFHLPHDNRIAKQVSHIDGNNTSTIIEVITQSLPHIVPNVLLAKREELLPLILCAANLHPSVKARDSMLNTLFNLIKRPDELQRQMILTGCIMFAQYNGPERVEEELLSQCWEQINDRHMERRLLVVDACCALIPYISSSIRGSLVLSMLHQMLLDERVEEVRAAIVRSLGILICFIDDADKFPQILNLYGRHMLPDTTHIVQEEVVKVLLPSLALWAISEDTMSDIVDLLFSALQNSLTEPNEDNEIKVILESFLPAIRHLHKLINFQFISLLYSGPYRHSIESSDKEIISHVQDGGDDLGSIFSLVSDRSEYSKILGQFTTYTSEEWYKTWDQFDLLVYTTFSRLAMLALSIHADDGRVVRALVNYVRTICVAVGHRVTSDKIEPKISEFFKFEDEITSQHRKVYTSPLLPILICGVKAAFTDPPSITQLTHTMNTFIVAMSEGAVPTQALDITITILLESSHLVEPFLDALLELMMKSSSRIKITCSHLLEVAVQCSNCSPVINSKILPGLVTLGRDPDSDVVMSTISPFGTILETSSHRETIDKVYTEFIRLLHYINENKHSPTMMSMINTFGRIGPNIEPQFREEVVIAQLSRWSKENNRCGDTILRRDVAVRLIDTYCALSCCFISNRIAHESFLPGLRALQLDLKELVLEGSAVIQSLIKDVEAKTGGANLQSASPSTQASASPVSHNQPSRPGSSGKSMLNKFMEKSTPTKMTTLFSKRK